MEQELRRIAYKHGIQYILWGIEGGDGWLWFKQDDEMKFKVQICINGDYKKYHSLKTEILDFFRFNNCSLKNEVDLGSGFGYRRNLIFISTKELERQNEEEKALKTPQALTYHIGKINADNSIVTLGNVLHSTQNIDNSIKEIEKQIEEKGGSDKKELYSTLLETEKIIREINKTKEIKTEKKFVEKLSGHLSKHGWFYGAIVALLGTTMITILGLGR